MGNTLARQQHQISDRRAYRYKGWHWCRSVEWKKGGEKRESNKKDDEKDKWMTGKASTMSTQIVGDRQTNRGGRQKKKICIQRNMQKYLIELARSYFS